MFELKEYNNECFSEAIIDTLYIERKSFNNCDFSSSDFTDVEIVHGCVFNECNFASSKLNGVKFSSCAFLGCRFKYATFFATVFDECKMTGSAFEGSDCELMQINGGDWSFCQLRYLSFCKQSFENIRFYEADLSGTKFRKCNIIGCEFNNTIAENLSFDCCDLRGSDINGMDLRTVDFKGSKVDLQQCVLIAEQYTEAVFEPIE